MKRIIFTLGDIPTGAERVVKTIAKQLDTSLYESFFVTLQSGDKIGDSLVQLKPDIVFCSQVHWAQQVADSVLEYSNIDLVFRCNYMLDDIQSEVVKQVGKSYRKAKLIIAQTNAMKKQLIEMLSIPSEKIIVHHNPVDREGMFELAGECSPYPNDAKRHFAWVGRFDPIKDLPTLIDAFKLARTYNNNIALYLIGECPTPEYYQEDGVYLVGYQQNPYPWIKYADSLILCSKSEAMPNVILEAIALGTHVICTKCCEEIEGYVLSNSGTLVEIMDVQGLAQAILEMK